MPKLPEPFRRFERENAAVVKAYEALGEACAKAGPLDARTRELVKLGMAIGGRLEGAVHSHARRALEARGLPVFGEWRTESSHSISTRDPDGHEMELYVELGPS